MATNLAYETTVPDDGAAAILQGRLDGRRIALRGVTIGVVLRDLIYETEVIQKYQNSENINIEVVYTFPLPVEAVLLDLEVKLAGKSLRGCVIERKAAQEKYEDAITSGDSAVLLEQSGDGLYTMNLGNLPAGESVEIRFRYAMLLNWSGDTLRMMIPTTLAPRYGVPSGLQPHEVPEHSLLVEYPLDLTVTVAGALASESLECASHAVTIERSPAVAQLRLAQGAMLDRDFVLNVRAAAATASIATVYPDGEGYVALASLRPAFPTQSETGPRSIKIVVDCSGSMNGDSITQARTALRAILDQLRPADEFNIIAFGSSQKTLFTRQTAVNAGMLGRAAGFVDALAADMGGTEMQAALAKAMALPGTIEQADILLITDGEVWDYENIAALAVKTHHRIFTVGVGSAVAETVVRQLSAATGGACELVSPRENMAATIVRQFQRIYQPFAVSTKVSWPAVPVWEHPQSIAAVFGGDTLHLLAGFVTTIEGEVAVEMRFADGAVVKQAMRLGIVPANESFAATAPRLAAARRLKSVGETEARQLALQYQLMSPYTAYFVLAVRDEKAQDLPELRTTPQMLAAGWGGVGDVLSGSDAKFCAMDRNVFETRVVDYVVPSSLDWEETVPSHMRGTMFSRSIPAPESEASPEPAIRPISPIDFAVKLNEYFSGFFRSPPVPNYLWDLSKLDLPSQIYNSLKYLRNLNWNEAIVVICFLHAFEQRIGKGLLSRNATRAIAMAVKRAVIPTPLLDDIVQSMKNLTHDEWNWDEPPEAPKPDATIDGQPA
jgi:Ca-activated chloride channel family protein